MKKKELNYCYFFLFYSTTSLLSLLSLTFKDLLSSPLIFYLICYSLAQALLEVSVFILLIQNTEKRWLQNTYSVLFFTIWMIQFTNFNMSRLLDTSLLYLLKFFEGHGIFHVIQVFQAINMNESMMGLIGISSLILPIFAIFLYRMTERLSKKKPFRISNRPMLILASTLCLSLLFCEWKVLPSLSYKTHEKYKKTLPLATTLWAPKHAEWILKKPISPPRNPKPMIDSFLNNPLQEKPNIYLFIIETLRRDFILREIAPALSSFGENHMQFKNSFANANATQKSWFSIFHSRFPYHWTFGNFQKKEGSPALQILKNWGYKTHVYSSADLRYFEMDTLLFGEKRVLADHIAEYSLHSSMPSWQRDASALRDFEKDLLKEEGKQGNLFIFFLDATHSEYDFPDNFPLRFTPITQKIDYLFLDTEHLELIKNRYRNAIAYIDSLMDHFFSTLKEKNLYEEAIIAITGDHGEEFFEEGALFHGTHLNTYQTNVPILLKFKDPPPIQTETATHIDIFPSILHFLTKEEIDPLFLDGRSVFSQNQHPFRLATLQNGSQTPEEFTLENAHEKIRAHFADPEDLYNCRTLKIISYETDQNTQTIPEDAFEMLCP